MSVTRAESKSDASSEATTESTSSGETTHRGDASSTASIQGQGLLHRDVPAVGLHSDRSAADGPGIQAKLTVNEPDDKYEKEAERVADAVMRMPEPESIEEPEEDAPSDRIQRVCPRCQRRHRQGKPLNCEECKEKLQRRADGHGRDAATSDGIEQAAAVAEEPGKPLSESTQSFFENRMGESFGDVRIHTGRDADRTAQSIDARAFTLGSDIVFRSEEYCPETEEGRRLLAHELTHVVQQRTGMSGASGSTGDGAPEKSIQRQMLPYPIGGGTEKETGSSGQSVRSQKPETEPSTGTPTEMSQQEGSSKQVESNGEGSFLSSFSSASEEAMECAERTGMAVSRLLTLDFDSLTSLLGLPEPKGSPPQKLDAVITALLHPCLQMLPGSAQLIAAEKLQEIQEFVRGAWKVIQNPNALLKPLKKALGERIQKVPEKARQKVEEKAEGKLSESHIEGILRHMEPKIQYLMENWWEVLKKSAWEQIWPWEGALTDLTTIFEHIGKGATHLWNLNLGEAGSKLLEFWRSTNALLGRFYGWFFIASTLIGTVIGAFFGGAGAVPGFIAGASFATEVGMGLLISAIAAESVNIMKGITGILTAENRKAREAAYEDIAESSLGLGIMGVLAALGAAAARFARAVIARFPKLKVKMEFAKKSSGETGKSKSLRESEEVGEFYEKVVRGEEGGKKQQTHKVKQPKDPESADVRQIKGVAETFGRRLEKAGIDDVGTLLRKYNNSPDELAKVLDTGRKRASNILKAARKVEVKETLKRRVDVETDRIIFEVKSSSRGKSRGLTERIRKQIRRDEMLRDQKGYEPVWIFYRTRPTAALRQKLQKAGIEIQVRDLPVGFSGVGAAGAKPEEEIGKPPSK